MKRVLKISLTALITIFLLLGFAMPVNMVGNWYQQFMPTPTGGPVKDIYFVDSLLGFAVSDSCILKTTNKGDNWTVKLQGYYIFQRIKFLNTNTGFACAGNNQLLKSTNTGENWNSITLPDIYPYDMAVIDENTIWLVNPGSLAGGVFYTSDGGSNWQQQANFGSQNPEHIYMFNSRIGFASEATGQILRRTSNSGLNWMTLPTAGAFTDMHFADSLTGWKSGAPGGPGFRKTTDGGLNWFDLTMPNGGNIVAPQIERFVNINRDTIYGVGAQILTGVGIRGMVNRTTNGGVNWVFQVPDSSYNNNKYYYIDFYNKVNGWAYLNIGRGIHTTTGGDINWYTGIQKISGLIPEKFELKQNYPNPFNPRTVIPYKLKKPTYVKIIIYDITGKEIQRIVDQKQQAGEYEVDFMGNFTATGVYFFSLLVDGKVVDTKKMILLK